MFLAFLRRIVSADSAKIAFRDFGYNLDCGKESAFHNFHREGLYVIGTICSLVALSLADAPLASSLFGLQPFYVFFYTLALSLFLPKILKEEIGSRRCC